jgi:hypothetical protein
LCADERALLDECRARQRFVEPTVDRLPAVAIEPQELQIRLPDPDPGVGLTTRRGKLPRQRRIHELRRGLAHQATRPLHEGQHLRGLPGAPEHCRRREPQQVGDPGREGERKDDRACDRQDDREARAEDRQRQEQRPGCDELEPAARHTMRASRRAQHGEARVRLKDDEVHEDQDQERRRHR